MRRLLPPLNALRAFEAAGRHLSFTRAASELSVTAAAVSQQVRLLEDQLGERLFLRKGRTLELTETGRAMLPGLQDGFDRIADTVRKTARRRASALLTINVSPCFAAIWLVPRLPRFQSMYPNVDVRVMALIHGLTTEHREFDVAIRYMPGPYPGMRVDRLMTEEIYPVCSPALASGPEPLSEPAHLRRHTLLHDETMEGIRSFPDWRAWLDVAGVSGIDTERGPRLSLSSMVIQSAIAGRGVALGRSTLVEGDVRAGRLVRPFGPVYPVRFAYYLVSGAKVAAQAKVRAFRDWIQGEADAP